MNIIQKIGEYIKSETVVDLNALKEKFPNRSVPSFHRDLAKLQCITSYTHNSRYYTMPDTPDYDEHGIWRHGDIMFSRNSTAKETARVLICGSPSGLSHSELEGIVGIRLYNPLRALVKEEAITSVTDGKKLVFFSGDDAVGQRQRNNRSDIAAAVSEHPFNLYTVIDVLLAVFLEKNDNAEDAYRFLKSARYPHITRKEVDEIFEYYKLPGKKN